MDIKNNNGRIDIIKDADGKNFVLVNDIRFKGRRGINWGEVEMYLKEYVGNCYEIIESADKVYIGADFPDEYCHSKDIKRYKCKGEGECECDTSIGRIGSNSN